MSRARASVGSTGPSRWVQTLRAAPDGHRLRGLGTLHCMEYAPDGTRLATGGSVGVVLWDLRARRVLARLAREVAPVRALAFSPDGARLAALGEGGRIALCDLERMTTTAVLRPERDDDDDDPESSPRLQFSPAGDALLILEETQARLLLGGELWSVAGPDGPLEEDAVIAGFSAEGALVVLREGTAALLDPAAEDELRLELRRELSFRAGRGVACCSDDGRFLFAPAAGRGAGHVLVALADGEVLATVRIPGTVEALRLAARPTLALVTTSRGESFLPLPARGDAGAAKPWRPRGEGFTDVLALAPDGEQVAVGDSYYGRIRFHDLTGRETAPGLGRYIYASDSAVSLASLDARAATALLLGSIGDGQNSCGWAQDWDLVDDRPGRELSDELSVFAISAAHVPGTDLAAVPERRRGVLLAARGSDARRRLDHASGFQGAATARRGALVVGGGENGELVLWDRASGERVAEVRAHGEPISGLGVHPGGELLATCSQDGSVRFWSVPALLAAGVSEGGGLAAPQASARVRGMLYQIAFSADGTLCAVGTAKGEACVIRVDDAAIVTRVGGHEREVLVTTFHPRTGELVTGSPDGRLAVWDPRTGAPHGEITGAAITGAGFDADGRVFVLACADGTIRIWDLPPEE